MILFAIGACTPARCTRSVQHFKTMSEAPQASRVNTKEPHTDRLHKECIIVEVILNEQDIPLTLLSRPLYHDIERTLKINGSIMRAGINTLPIPHRKQSKLLTSSSMSRNATPRASETVSKSPTSFLTFFHPLLAPSTLHPRTPDPPQLSDNIRCALRVRSELVPVMRRRSGKPSRLASPRRGGVGNAGEVEVSNTRSDCDEEGKRVDTGSDT